MNISFRCKDLPPSKDTLRAILLYFPTAKMAFNNRHSLAEKADITNK